MEIIVLEILKYITMVQKVYYLSWSARAYSINIKMYNTPFAII